VARLAEAGLVNLGEVIPGNNKLDVERLAAVARLVNLGKFIPGTSQL
jgi:hypothetical protein